MPKGQSKPRATIPAHLRGPLPPPHFGPLNSQLSEAALGAQRIRILGDRLEGLARHYGIKDTSPNKWFWLSAELAKELGLLDRPVKRGPEKGVKRSVTDDEQLELVKKVDAINAEKGRGVEDAIRILKIREPKYRKKRGLATRYYEAADKFKPPQFSLWGKRLRKKSTGNN